MGWHSFPGAGAKVWQLCTATVQFAGFWFREGRVYEDGCPSWLYGMRWWETLP